MVFIPSNLSVAVDTISGGSLRIHGYRPVPADDDVFAAGYFTGAALLGMRVGDLVVIITPTGATGGTVIDITSNNATIAEEAGASGTGFEATVVPTVTAGAYSAGDIMGGLLTFPVASSVNRAVIISGVSVRMKSDRKSVV